VAVTERKTSFIDFCQMFYEYLDTVAHDALLQVMQIWQPYRHLGWKYRLIISWMSFGLKRGPLSLVEYKWRATCKKK
jgi:hypothetical protein